MHFQFENYSAYSDVKLPLGVFLQVYTHHFSMTRPRLRALLIDLSGTLHIDKEQTPCAVEALRRIRQARIPIRFCSNTSKESTQDLRDKLNNIGFEVNDGELWTSLGALSDVVKVRELKK